MHFLSKKYRAIAVDFLGFGDSDPAPREYQIIDHAKTMISFMDAMGLKSARRRAVLRGGDRGGTGGELAGTRG